MNKKELKEIIHNVEDYNKLLIMGDAVVDFKNLYDKPIKRVENREDVREIVSYYINLRNLEIPLVIEGLSFLKEDTVFLLLKLVEEVNFNMILLSRFDNISSIMLSRIKNIIKYNKGGTESEFLPVNKGIDILEEKLDEESSYYDRLKYISEISPQIFYTESLLKGVRRNKDKFRDILYR